MKLHENIDDNDDRNFLDNDIYSGETSGHDMYEEDDNDNDDGYSHRVDRDAFHRDSESRQMLMTCDKFSSQAPPQLETVVIPRNW